MKRSTTALHLILGATVATAACSGGSPGGPGGTPEDAAGRGGAVADARPGSDAIRAPDAALSDAPSPAPDPMPDPSWLVISPTAVTFPETRIYTPSARQRFVVTNRGPDPTGLIGVDVTNRRNFEISSACRPALAPGQSCTVDVIYSPQDTGTQLGRVRVGGAPGGFVEASLAGSTPGSSPLRFAPNPVGFLPTSIAPSAGARMITVAVANSASQASGPLAATVVSDGDFAKGTDGCTTSLAPNASCNVTVRFKPQGPGGREGSLEIVDAANGVKSAVRLTGQGLDGPYLGTAGLPPAFPDTPVGQSVARMTTMTNIGPQPTGPLSFMLTGDINDFKLEPGTCAMPLPAANGDTPGTCAFRLTFRPTVERDNSVFVHVGATPGGGVVMNVTALAVAMDANRLTVEVIPDPPFANVRVGATAVATVRVKNAGARDAGKLSFTLGGVHVTEFGVRSSTCGDALPPGGTCALEVVFTPTAPGTRNATLRLRAPNGYAPEVPLDGTAVK